MLGPHECHICYDTIRTRRRRHVAIQKCPHIYHRRCIRTWREEHPEWQGQCFYCETRLRRAGLKLGVQLSLSEMEELGIWANFVQHCPHCHALVSKSYGCIDIKCNCGRRFRFTAYDSGEFEPTRTSNVYSISDSCSFICLVIIFIAVWVTVPHGMINIRT